MDATSRPSLQTSLSPGSFLSTWTQHPLGLSQPDREERRSGHVTGVAGVGSVCVWRQSGANLVPEL